MNAFGRDNFFSICFILISAAAGMGVLTVPWVFMQMGLGIGLGLLIYWGLLCGSTVYYLIIGGLHYKVSNITELVYYSIIGEIKLEENSIELEESCKKNQTKKRIAKNITFALNVLILLDCLFFIPCLLILLSDFLIPVNKLVYRELPRFYQRYSNIKGSQFLNFLYNIVLHVSLFFTNRNWCIIFFCIVVFLICLPSNFSGVRIASVLSVISSLSTTTIIVYYATRTKHPPECSEYINSDFYCRKGDIMAFNCDSFTNFWRIMSVSNIILFSHFCHFIVIPTTQNIKMSKKKIKLIVFAFSFAIFLFNGIVGTAGYSTFRLNTLPNIINNYTGDEPLIIMTRLYLTLSLTVTLCIETIPLVDSFTYTMKTILNSICRRFKKGIDARENKSCKNPESADFVAVEDDSVSNNYSSTLGSTANSTPYIGIYSEKRGEESVEQGENKCMDKKVRFRFVSKEKLQKIINFVILISFSGVMATSFGSVAKLIQVTGGTLDGVFIFLVPGWVYYSTYFRFNNKLFGTLLLGLYVIHFIISAISGVTELFKME
ncbi:protein with signal peptide [Cryptosporidium ryanae]|uniref:protein with signal peptide n=1 Tax=Cryptosporidium ryanae TaxID=515981 RepID=UPI00351A2C8A|nr:protein with signal peptide [Cryptosporidium ryanae]